MEPDQLGSWNLPVALLVVKEFHSKMRYSPFEKVALN